MKRQEAREQAFMVLFEKIFNETDSIEEIVETAQDAGIIKINSFAENILKNVQAHIDEIDNTISENLQGWTMSRLPKVSLAVLRLGVCEILFIDDVPNGVAVNEAVELAKKYGTEDDAKYINGVLSSVVRAVK